MSRQHQGIAMIGRRRLLVRVVALAVCAAPTASAVDSPAALIDLPYVVSDTAAGLDTVVHLSNTSRTDPVDVLCILENGNSHCSNAPSTVCRGDTDCPAGGTCAAGYAWIDFFLRLTVGQPITYRLSQGLFQLPCDATDPYPCVWGTSAGHIPPASEDPFIGRLLCLAVDANDQPTDANLLSGTATVERYVASPVTLDVARYAAIGVPAIPGANDGDYVLCLGDGDPAACPNGAEYEPCPAVNVVDHLFENAADPVGGGSRVFTRLALAPCTRDSYPGSNVPGTVLLDYLVFNEFEQRLIVRKEFSGLQFGRLSDIHPLAFNAGLQGTLAGQTRIRSANGIAVHAVAIEERETSDGESIRSAAYNVHEQGWSVTGDVIIGAASGVCGNGVQEAGEQCDDGNTAPTDGCDAACRLDPCYAACAPGGCTPWPGQFLCNQGASSLSVKDTLNDDRDRLEWRWEGPGFNPGSIDNPALATDYTLCVYAAGSVAMRATVEHAGTCGSSPCWRETRSGFAYRQGATNGDGIAGLKVAEAADGTQRFVLHGKRVNLPLPGAAGPGQYFQGPVSAVLVKSNAPQDYECWEATYTTVGRNDATFFEATDP